MTALNGPCEGDQQTTRISFTGEADVNRNMG